MIIIRNIFLEDYDNRMVNNVKINFIEIEKYTKNS